MPNNSKLVIPGESDGPQSFMPFATATMATSPTSSGIRPPFTSANSATDTSLRLATEIFLSQYLLDWDDHLARGGGPRRQFFRASATYAPAVCLSGRIVPMFQSVHKVP